MKSATKALALFGMFMFGLVLNGTSAFAVIITFEEFPYQDDNPTGITNEYAPQGVLFTANPDGVIRGGNSNGDPGNWNLEGTNGPQFLGYNGDPPGSSPFEDTMDFTSDVTNVSFDVSRASIAPNVQRIDVTGYLDGGLVDNVSFSLDAINVWSTVTLIGTFDVVHFSVTGFDSFRPFGIDNLNFSIVPEPTALTLAALGLCIITTRRRR